MKRKAGKDGGVTRRHFLGGLALTAGGTLAADALGQSVSAALAESRGFSIAGAEVRFWLTRVSDVTLRISILAKGSRLDPRTAFAGMGLVERLWPAPMAMLDAQTQ